MHHYDKFAHGPAGNLGLIGCPEGAASRLLAAMAELGAARTHRHPADQAAPPRGLSPYVRRARESDRAYSERRSAEERRAASSAAGDGARRAHLELSALHARRTISIGRPAPAPEPPRGALAAAARASRQDALLDAALIETFPASDPVSVALVS